MTLDLTDQTNLLSIAERILKYEDALTKASGERFNIFNLLGVGNYEVKTHSPVIAELLNPNGSHGQGSILLETFCKLRGIKNFDLESCRVKKEYHIGHKTDDEGGRVDILITDSKGRCIIIENKVFAGLQPNQLGRYRKRFPDNGNNHLFYLTLYGEDSTEPNIHNILNISYHTDMVKWLTQCQKEAVNAPIIRETITQYIHLIRQLTNQNVNSVMNQEITKSILQTESTYLAYSALYKAQKQVEVSILDELRVKLNKAAFNLGLNLDFSENSDLRGRYAGFGFTSSDLNQQNVRITFQFGESNRNACQLGFSRTAEKRSSPIEKQLFQEFKYDFPGARGQGNPWWVVIANWEKCPHWGDDVMAAIKFGDFAENIIAEVKRIMDIFQKVTSPRELDV